MKKCVLLAICTCLWGMGCGSSKSADEIRKAAEAVLAKGGSVTLAGATSPIKMVAKLPKGKLKIVRIDLADKPITDADLAELLPLTQVEGLNLQSTRITDAGLAHLKDFRNLNELNLYRDAITDRGLEQLDGLTRLKKLELSYTQIGDPGLEHLARLHSLQTLHVNGTGVTEAGVAKFKKERPSVQLVK